MKIEFRLDDYVEKIKNGNSYFHTFINRDSLAVGVLVLQTGEEDTQEPHENDEVYYVLSGDGHLKIKTKIPCFPKKIVFCYQKYSSFFSWKYYGTQSIVFLWWS